MPDRIEKLEKMLSRWLGHLSLVAAKDLIANGVTVGKPLVEHLHPIDAYEGLKGEIPCLQGRYWGTGYKLLCASPG